MSVTLLMCLYCCLLWKMSLPSATTTGGHEEDDRETRMAKRLVLLKTEESQMLLALADLKKECLLMEEEVERADQKTREKLEEQKKEREVKYLTEFEKYITSEERYRYYDTTEKVTVVHTKLAKIAMAIREVEEIGSRRPL